MTNPSRRLFAKRKLLKSRTLERRGLMALTSLGSLGGAPKDNSALEVNRPPVTFGRAGDLEVLLAGSRRDVIQAQKLRYHVFYEEMSAQPTPLAAVRRRDQDAYDSVCDHLLVTDNRSGTAPIEGWHIGRSRKVVGTYRVLRQEVAEKTLGFYTQSEYDIAPLLQSRPDLRFMELGRSCVHSAYRNRRTVELLWHGLWTYVRQHRIDVMIGCASFPGADPSCHSEALSFLHHNALAPDEWRCRAHGHLHQAMDIIPKADINAKAALKAMPPLIKAYLRLGAFVGDGAVIDHQFNTTDVLIIMPVSKIDPRYFEHFGRPEEAGSRLAKEKSSNLQ